MQMPPLAVIESWPLPNYVDPVTRGPANIVINLVFFPLVCLVIGLRVYTRLRISKSFGADDWLILASLFPAAAYAVISLLAELHFKWNRHVWDVRVDTISLGLKMVMITQLLFAAATTLTKCSMLTLTYRVIGTGSSTLRNITATVMILVALQGITFIFIVIFQCRRPSDYWTLSFKPQKCLSQTTYLLIAGIINTITDFLVVTLPIPPVWGLRLPRRQQIILVLLFGAGFMVTVAGCVRTIYTYRVSVSYDQTWIAFPVWISSSVELYVGVICASIPPTKKFFSRYVPNLLGSSILSRSKTAASNPSKGTQASNANNSYLGELEMGITSADPSPEPYKAKKSEDALSVEATASFDTARSGYNVLSPERVGIAESSRRNITDGIYDTQRGDSEDELVVGSSGDSRGIFGQKIQAN